MTDRSRPASTLPEFAQRAEASRVAGDPIGAERIIREGLAEEPSADAVLVLARLLLEQDRGAEALGAIEQFASRTRLPGDGPEPVLIADDLSDPEAVVGGADEAVFDVGVSDNELELAFETAQPEPDQMISADSIAQHAIAQTDTDLSGGFASPEMSYATETVAGLLEDQGDVASASRVREVVAQGAAQGDPVRQDRDTATILELERWLGNLRGGMRA